MGKKISFVIISSVGTVRQASFSKTLIRFVGLCFVTCLIVLAMGICDYYNLRNNLKINYVNNRRYKEKIADQSHEVVGYQKQVQKFADEINTLKSRMVELNNLENKIRIIADLEKSTGQDGFYGIGGSIPEDLDIQIPLGEQHSSLIREMNQQTPQLEYVSTQQLKSFESIFMHLERKRDLFSSTPTIRPTEGWLTSQFGYRKSPYTGLREFHKGLDISNRKGESIVAPADGTVTFVGASALRGNYMIVNHGYGVITQYAHLQKALKRLGEEVKRGDTIALMGNTGRSTGPHLHYEVYLNGVPVNPSKYILN